MKLRTTYPEGPMVEVIAPIAGLILLALFVFGSWR
jgi:hypothetical protein